MLSLPVKAHNRLPEIVPVESTVDFGECFLKHTYTKAIRIRNMSAGLKAAFELVSQDEPSRAIGYYSLEPNEGIVDEDGSVSVVLSFTAARKGPLSLPVYVRIQGTTSPSFHIDIVAHSVGPTVVVSAAAIDWGKTPVLQHVHRPLVLTNHSLIPAEFSGQMRKAASPFALSTPLGTLEPGETRELSLSVHLEETTKVADDLILQIKDAPEQVLSLAATGTGSTIWSERALDTLDFGERFASRMCSMEFTLENRGRRSQTIAWSNASAPPAKAGIAVPSTFTIVPEKVLMEPDSECTFVVRGLTAALGEAEETLHCSLVPAGGKPGKPFLETVVRGTFLQPLVEPSQSELAFAFVYEDDAPLGPLTQTVRLTNVSPLPLTLAARCSPPFSVDLAEVTLGASEGKVATVTFDPTFDADRVSRRHEAKLSICYREHPRTDEVALVGDTAFPNLAFDLAEADFGCLPNGATRTLSLSITNSSRVAATYEWAIAADSVESEAAAGLFDVLPLRGCLQPSESETVELLYRGGIDIQAAATMLCKVRGGPEYEMPVCAESAAVSYELSHSNLDFGLQSYDQVQEKELWLTNAGRVPVSFEVKLDEISRPNIVEVVPATGQIAASSKQKIVVRMLPGLPQRVHEVLLLQVGHFEPEAVVIMAEGTYPRVTVSLPRLETPEYLALLRQANTACARKRAEREAPAPTSELDATALVAELCKAPGRTLELAKELVAPPAASSLEGPLGQGDEAAPSTEERGSDSHISQGDFRKTVAALGLHASRESMDTVFATIAVGQARASLADLSTYLQRARSGSAPHGGSAPPRSRASAKSTRSARSICEKPKEVLEVETEAERLQLLAVAAKQLAELQAQRESRPPSAVGSLERQQTRLRTASLHPLPPPADFILGSYVLDFGNVTFGKSSRRTFRIRNMGWSPVSFEADKKVLAAVGIKMEPDKVVKLPGLPSAETTDFLISFQAPSAKKGEPPRLGLLQHDLKLDLKPGPPVLLLVRANVVLPEVSLAHESLEWGEVQVGHAKTITLVVENPTAVAAEWRASFADQAKDALAFSCAPASGTLAPKERARLQLTFTPLQERTYALKMLVKTTGNPKSSAIALHGAGYEKRLELSTGALSLSPVLPHGDAVEEAFSLINPTDHPIEVYVTQLDRAHLEEEAMLRETSLFEGGALRLPPREPGEPIWQELLEEHRTRLAQQRAEEAATAEGEDDENDAQSAKSEADEGVGEVTEVAEGAEELRRCVLLLGAPLSGFTSQAKMVGESLGLPVVDLEHLVREAAERARDAAAAAASAAAAAAAEEGGEGEEEADRLEAEPGVEASAGDAGSSKEGLGAPLAEAEAPAAPLEPVDEEALTALLEEERSSHPSGRVPRCGRHSPCSKRRAHAVSTLRTRTETEDASNLHTRTHGVATPRMGCGWSSCFHRVAFFRALSQARPRSPRDAAALRRARHVAQGDARRRHGRAWDRPLGHLYGC